jgi:hypothetical protein
MFKSKSYRVVRLILFCMLLLFYFYSYVYKPYNSKQEILNASYGIRSNHLRVKLKIPIIDSDMSPIYEYKKSDDGNRWESSNEFPDYGVISHPFKNVDADSTTLRLEEETDSFRRKINDSIFQQVNIYSKISGDTISKRDGLLFYVRKVKWLLDSPYDKKIKLDEHGIDSVTQKWHLSHLIKGK